MLSGQLQKVESSQDLPNTVNCNNVSSLIVVRNVETFNITNTDELTINVSGFPQTLLGKYSAFYFENVKNVNLNSICLSGRKHPAQISNSFKYI